MSHEISRRQPRSNGRGNRRAALLANCRIGRILGHRQSRQSASGGTTYSAALQPDLGAIRRPPRIIAAHAALDRSLGAIENRWHEPFTRQVAARARCALDFPVVQAALSGYSDWAMRVIARRLGAPYTLCEVMLDQFLIEASHSRKNQGRLRVSDDEHPVGGQLMGAKPEDFGPAALRARGGGVRCDRHQFRLPREKSAGPLPRRLSARPGGNGAGDRRPRARGGSRGRFP